MKRLVIAATAAGLCAATLYAQTPKPSEPTYYDNGSKKKETFTPATPYYEHDPTPTIDALVSALDKISIGDLRAMNEEQLTKLEQLHKRGIALIKTERDVRKSEPPSDVAAKKK